MSLSPALHALADAATQLAHGNAHAALVMADALTTSRAGFRALLAGHYRITDDEWDTERLARDIDAASPADAEIAARLADRVSDVGRVVTWSHGVTRTLLRDALEAVQPITAGHDPYRPIGVAVTSMAQRQIELGERFAHAQLRVATAGPRSAPALVLIPGHASRIEEYESLATMLARDFHVHVLDLLGSGYADKPDRELSIELLEGVVETALDALGLTRDVRLAGGGLGGNLTLRLAYRDRLDGGKRRICKASAWSVAGWGETKPLLATGARLLRHAPDFVFWPVAEKQLGEQYASTFAERDAMIQAGMRYRREVYTRAFQDAYFCIAADQVGTSMLAHAKELTTPTLLLAGELDTGSLGIRAAVERLAHEMGESARVIAGSGYAIANEKPSELAIELARFLR
ncbi:MAG: hypothetical protein K1X94_14805 [Sandaracinaceae bacterium]|nr:hypothetical protein [Sandaracinaceae bacterium]